MILHLPFLSSQSLSKWNRRETKQGRHHQFRNPFHSMDLHGIPVERGHRAGQRGPMLEVKITRNVVVPPPVAVLVRSFELFSSVVRHSVNEMPRWGIR